MPDRTFWELLAYKTRANLRSEVSRYYLAYLWWVFDPLFSMGILYVVFGIFMGGGQENFILFLLLGTTQWSWFASTVQNSSGSIFASGGLMRQVYIPKFFFPLEVFLQDAFKHCFVLGLLAVFLLFYPVPFAVSWLAAPIVIIAQGLFVLAVSMVCAALVPFLPDFKFILASLIQALFFVSGIFFSLEAVVLPKHLALMYANPMAGIIREYRRIFLEGQWPDWMYLAYVVLVSGVILVCGLALIRRCDHLYPRLCSE